MPKWADYGVFRVKYNRDHTAIVEVEVRPDLGEKFGDPQKASRQEVVSAIDRRVTFVTVYSRDGQSRKGEDVRTVTIQGEKYLRTDNNSTRADNLG
ncbi:DUF3892 domain-containing protein, partial [Archangium violaceum]